MRKDLFKVIVITIFAVIIRIICTVIFGGDPISVIEPFGNIAGKIGIIPSVIIMFLLSYLHLALIGYFILRKRLAGNYFNAVIVGSVIGILWLYGMFEAGIIKNIPQHKELLFGISEAIPIIILFLLISFSLKNEQSTFVKSKLSYGYRFLTVIIFTALYMAIRYFSYSVLSIESKFIEKPLETFLWTLGNGMIIGLFYLIIYHLRSLGKRNVFVFGILIFGIDWFLYNMFVPVFFNTSISDIFGSFILRTVMDVISVCSAVLIIEIIIKNKIRLTTGST